MWRSATSSSSSSVSPQTHHHDTLLPPQTSSTSQPSLGQTQTSRLRRSLHLHVRLKKENKKTLRSSQTACTDQHFHNEHCTLIRQQTTRSATLVLLAWVLGGVGEGGECWSIPPPPPKIDFVSGCHKGFFFLSVRLKTAIIPSFAQSVSEAARVTQKGRRKF